MFKSKLEDRSEHVKDVVSQYKNKRTAIKKLANELFLSEKTIENDLKK